MTTRTGAARWALLALAGALAGASTTEVAGGRVGGLQASRGPAASKGSHEVTLVDPGRSPASPLRRRLTEGTVVHGTIEVRRSSQPTVDGIPGTQETLPPVRVIASTVVDAVTTKGDASLVTTYEDIVVVDDGTVGADARARLEAALAPVEKMVLRATVSPRNEIKAIETTGTAALDGAVAQLLERFTEQLGILPAPFPREPVGAGARWRFRTRAVVARLAVDKVYDLSLREVAGTRAVVDVEYAQSAARQRASVYPDVDSATRVDVTKYRMAGQAAVTIDLGEPMPVEGSARVAGVQVLRVRDGEATSTRAERVLFDVLVTREPDAG